MKSLNMLIFQASISCYTTEHGIFRGILPRPCLATQQLSRRLYLPIAQHKKPRLLGQAVYTIPSLGHTDTFCLPCLKLCHWTNRGNSWRISVRTMPTEESMEAGQVKGAVWLARWLSACHSFLNNTTDTYSLKALTVWRKLYESRKGSHP